MSTEKDLFIPGSWKTRIKISVKQLEAWNKQHTVCNYL